MKIQSENSDVETTKDKGDALEKSIEFLFKVAGFETKRNERVSKYEIDVIAKIGNRKIFIECKNYQKSTMTIRNLIHQWNSKNELLKAHKVIIVIAGIQKKESDVNLANQFNIELWDDSDITELFSLSLKPVELKEFLLQKVSFKKITISEAFYDDMVFSIIHAKLSNANLSEEKMYGNLEKWLKSHILTELAITTTSPKVRSAHVEIFEGKKSQAGFFKLLKAPKTSKEIWESFKKTLNENNPLGDECSNKYLQYQNELENHYIEQISNFKNLSHEKLNRILIKSWLENTINGIDTTVFTISGSTDSIFTEMLNEGQFKLWLNDIDEKQSNIIDWIITSIHHTEANDAQNKGSFWIVGSFEDLIEMIYRIVYEFFDFNEKNVLKGSVI